MLCVFLLFLLFMTCLIVVLFMLNLVFLLYTSVYRGGTFLVWLTKTYKKKKSFLFFISTFHLVCWPWSLCTYCPECPLSSSWSGLVRPTMMMKMRGHCQRHHCWTSLGECGAQLWLDLGHCLCHLPRHWWQGVLWLVVGHLDNLGYCGGFGSVWAWLTGRQSHLILGVHVWIGWDFEFGWWCGWRLVIGGVN